ncbi:MAG: tRNA (adenosine(37)-N6)-dimethylallyltransferase MiaA [Actinomycetota bacterium]|nr:tRNA (adenosine(37)-N6)-dimethylallyltransferase MiaA [Actinomycetota bacterium]
MNGAAARPLFALVGPTASGKSRIGLLVAERIGAEIVSVDSMLVYRGMDVGTAKPTPEECGRVPHHLLDLAEPQEPFSVAAYQRAGRAALRDIASRSRRALLVGGSGLYFRALVDDLEFPATDPSVRSELEILARAAGPERLHSRLAAFDPEAAGRIEPANARRTVRALEVAAVTGRPFSSFAASWERYPAERVRVAGIDPGREALDERIRVRVQRMLRDGFLDEVEDLVRRGLGGWLTSSQAIGYAEMTRHLAGECSLADAVASTERRTRALARRQRAWFRRDPRVRWFGAGPDSPDGPDAVLDEIMEYLSDG